MVSKLANYMADEVDSVTVFLLNDEKIAYTISENVKVKKIENPDSGNKILRTVSRLKNIRSAFKTEKLDVLFAFTATMFPYAAICAKGLKTKVIGAERANPKVYGRRLWKILSFMSNQCDGFVFQTEGAKDYYPDKIGKVAVVIPNAVPGEICDRKTKFDEKRPVRFCTSGRLHTDKDYDTLLNAFAGYLTCAKGTLTIFGDGVLREKYENMCKDLGIERNVTFAGFVSDVYEKIAEHDVFVFSSKAEGMPNALLEALAIGLPCVSTDCDFGPREFIKNGENGFLCKVSDAKDMADKLIWLYEHQDKIEVMGNCAKDVRYKYSVEKIMRQYLDYAQAVLSGNNGKTCG